MHVGELVEFLLQLHITLLKCCCSTMMKNKFRLTIFVFKTGHRTGKLSKKTCEFAILIMLHHEKVSALKKCEKLVRTNTHTQSIIMHGLFIMFIQPASRSMLSFPWFASAVTGFRHQLQTLDSFVPKNIILVSSGEK